MEPAGPSHRPEKGSRGWQVRTYRKWHRWIGAAAGIFLIFAGATGTATAFSEFFGEEERIREATRWLESPMTADADPSEWGDPLAAAIATVNAESPGAFIDRVSMEFKGETPRIMVFTGRPGGGEDRRFVLDARTGDLLSVESYADKSFLVRLHSGEAFGDGGLVVAMFWGLALVLIGASGIWIYFSMRRPGGEGLAKVFW